MGGGQANLTSNLKARGRSQLWGRSSAALELLGKQLKPALSPAELTGANASSLASLP